MGDEVKQYTHMWIDRRFFFRVVLQRTYRDEQ